MKRLLLLFAALAVAGCSGGTDPAAPAPQGADFAGFVQDQFAATADDTDPVDINGIDFVGLDDDNPNAFDNLLD